MTILRKYHLITCILKTLNVKTFSGVAPLARITDKYNWDELLLHYSYDGKYCNRVEDSHSILSLLERSVGSTVRHADLYKIFF